MPAPKDKNSIEYKEFCGKINRRKKNKSYKEIYGEKKSEEIKQKMRGPRPNMEGRVPWNKGLKKETDERVRKNAENKKGVKHSKETIKKMIKSHKGKKHTLESKKKISESRFLKCGELNGNWKGGKSSEEYCPIFKDKEWREMIYERDGNNCQICGCSKHLNFKLVGHKYLTIHHIDHNKKNCHPKNCILVCARCNHVVEGKNVKSVYESLFKMKMQIEKGYL